MNIRTALPLVVLACCFSLVGCKKRGAFLVVDSETQQPLPMTLVDHWTLYQFPSDQAGEPYLKEALPLDEAGWVEIDEPTRNDTYVFRLAGYQQLKVRMTEIGEKAEYLVVGGPKKLEWFELELREDDDEDVGTFIVPLKKN